MQYDMLFDWEFSRSFKCLFSNDFREFTISSIKYSRTKLWLLQLQGKLKGMEMVLLECLVGSLWLLLLGDYHFRSWPFRLKCYIVYVILNLAYMYLTDILISVFLLCRSLNVLFTNPIWVLVTRMQVHYLNIFHIFWTFFIDSFTNCKMKFIFLMN